jgi:surface carbohydrate biosynthesis protein
VRLAFIVDNPFRDLPGLTLLSMYLCQQGAHCFLVPMYLSQQETWSLAPDFILCHYLRINNQAEIKSAMQAGIKVGLLDTEGGVSQAMAAYGQALAPDADTRFGLSVVCAWGPLFSDYAVRESWYLADQLKLTGHPRFDFYGDPWREAAVNRSTTAGEVASPFVLINSNVFLVNSCFQTPEKDIEMYVNVFGFDRDTVLRWQELEQQKMAAMIDLTNNLAETFPEVNVVFRPHPFEKTTTYQELMKPRPNLFVIKKGSVDGWILRSLAVIQHGCSTAVEAGMAGVPSFSPRWINSATSVETAEAVSVPCETQEELFSCISQLIKGTYEIPAGVHDNIERIVSERFYRIDGCSHQRVGQAILQAVKDDSARVDLDYCRRQYWAYDGSLKGWLGTQAKKVLGLTPDQSLFFWRKNNRPPDWHKTDKYFDARQVDELVQTIEPVAVKNFSGKWRRVKVASTSEDYIFPHQTAESVVIKPI